MMRILIIKLSSIGDVVHTLPTLAAIREALPRAEISWAVERRAAEILRDNPFIDRLIEVDTKALRRLRLPDGETLLAPRQQLRQLRASAFDLTLDFQGLFKSALIARLSGAPRRFGFASPALREPLSRLLHTKSLPGPMRAHVIEKNLALAARALGIAVPVRGEDFGFPINISEEHRREAEEAMRPAGDDFAILNPGGGWVTKLWGAERFAALADELWTHYGLRSLVTYGPGEEELARRVETSARSGKARAVRLSLKSFVALAQRTRLYVGGDTGPTHLAVAARAPIVGLFGPTEWWRNGSPRPDDLCVERFDINCRENCHRRQCGEWVCLDVEVGRVLAAAGERLRRAGAQSAFAEAIVDA
ncbi:MAG TPA: lipopolysaccharide heptosyltransferase I [Pyrinomonadaceae bacterium]|jgi:lipopolysaccharide heptosyltransferase I|nr:lipopolysaccharide heptosyltransferase I [Pyrinomonadaceae bacterium]